MEKDAFPILGVDHVEFFVDDAKQIADLFCRTFGFKEIAYAGPDAGVPVATSYVLEQGKIKFVVTEAVGGTQPITDMVRKHGNGVRDISLLVPDARRAFKVAVERGAIPILGPHINEDENGHIIFATIGTYGDTIHSLVERQNYHGVFMPGYVPLSDHTSGSVGLCEVDHVVGNVELGQMDFWANYYAKVMGFTNLVHYTDSQISTEYTALMSKVMWNGGKIKFPINEPAPSRRKSQIDEFLEFYGGAGVQHIAMETDSIVETVSTLQDRGVEFLPMPDAYYDGVREKFSDVEAVDVDTLARLGILADRDEDGYLLQIFTKPIFDRPTFFFEVIERQGSRGFGLGNFKALFEAMEREQAKRGNL